MSLLRRRPRGLNIAELLISFVLVLMLLLYTLSSFVASNNYIKRGKEYSAALFLSQTKMEELQVTPISDIKPETSFFDGAFEKYQYQVSLLPWEGDLQVLEVVVTSPRGAVAHIRTLRQSQAHQDVIVDPYTNLVAYTKPGSGAIQYHDDGAQNTAPGAVVALADGTLGGLAGVPGRGFLWAVNSQTNNLISYKEKDPDPWGKPVTFDGVSSPSPRLSGICSDEYGNLVFAADWSNRGVWIFADSLPGLPRGFVGKRPQAPVSPPLGIPSSVATDPSGSFVLVADTENQCLRKLFVDLTDNPVPPIGYSSDDLEPVKGVGYWSKKRLRPTQGMGAPQGVAINSTGWVSYTVDRAYLYRLEETTPDAYTWKRIKLDPKITAEGPSGLALDEFNNLLFIVTREGKLWKYVINDGNFAPVQGSGGGIGA